MPKPTYIKPTGVTVSAVLLIFAGTQMALAQNYGYTVIAKRGQVIGGKTVYGFSSPSLNNAGEVAFSASLGATGSDGGGVFTGSAAIASSGQALGGRTIASFFGGPWINNSGQIAFIANYTGGSGIFIGSGQAIATGQVIGGNVVNSFAPFVFLDDAGQVVFTGNSTTIFTSSSVLGSGLWARRNSSGQVAYISGNRVGTIGLGGANIGAGTFLDGKILRDVFSTPGSLSINNTGQLALSALFNEGAGTNVGIFRITFTGTPVMATAINLVVQGGQSIGGVTLGTGSAFYFSMNNSGTLAFSSPIDPFLSGGGNGIFTQNGLVLRNGTVIEGKTVASVGSPVINNSGQIASVVGFTDGTVAVVLATPGGGGGGGTSSVTINTTPAGQSVVVDGQTYTAPQTLSWTAGSSHTLGAPSPQGSGGTQYVFESWSNGGAPSQTITAPGAAATFTANFTTQHQLTTSVGTGGSAAGTIGPSSGFVNAGTPIVVTGTANPGYVFTGFSGDLSGLTNPQTLTINAPRSVVANFRSTAASIGTVLSLTGVATANGIALSKGSAVYVNDVLETRAASALGIVFINGAALTLSENSKVTVDKFVIDNPNPDLRGIVLSMLTGAMRWVGGALSPPVPHRVKTPVCAIGIRGTDFIARYSAGTLTIDLISGTLDLTPNQGTNTATVSGPITIVANGQTQSSSPLTPAQYTQLKTQVFPASPVVTSFRVLFGTQSYDLTGSARVRLPWQITGVQVTFSLPITVANAGSLGGITATGFAGLGTNTLTWSVAPIALGDLTLALAGTGLSAITGSSGVALESGAGASQRLKVLWGDFTDDGAVSSADLVGVNNARVAPYNLFADANGDGAVTVADVAVIRSRIGAVLP